MSTLVNEHHFNLDDVHQMRCPNLSNPNVQSSFTFKFDSISISDIEDDNLTLLDRYYYHDYSVPNRTHKRPRIQKKWIHRYGTHHEAEVIEYLYQVNDKSVDFENNKVTIKTSILNARKYHMDYQVGDK